MGEASVPRPEVALYPPAAASFSILHSSLCISSHRLIQSPARNRRRERARMSLDFFRLSQEQDRDQSVRVVELELPEALDSGEFDRLNDALLRVFAEEP